MFSGEITLTQKSKFALFFALSVTHGVTPPPDGGRLKGSPYGRAGAFAPERATKAKISANIPSPTNTGRGEPMCSPE